MAAATLPAEAGNGGGAAKPAAGSSSGNADLTAWLAVVAGAIGALMATLDISIVNSALPTIQGEIGASSTEGTWIATSYLVAEIIIIPLTAWLERVFGLKRFLLIASVLFTGFSIVCGLSTTLTMMIVGRVGQGFTGGAMIPTGMTIIATRLPRHQQPVGTALFGSTLILGPVMGPLAGGWLTENFSWHYAFFINIPICIILMVFLTVGLSNTKMRLDELLNADWLGILGLALGLGGLTVVLEEGNREQWFQSTLIWQLTGVTIIGFILISIGQLFAKRPVIKLALLRNRAFAAVFVLGLLIGSVLYGTAYVIPQFLAAIAGYNAYQSGQIVFLSGIPAAMMMPLFPLLVKRFDLRYVVLTGMLIMAGSCWLDTTLTVNSDGSDFVVSQLMRGLGQALSMLFLNQAAIASVKPDEAGDASGLFNAARNLGGSIALALLATLQERREEFHRWSIHETLPANSPSVQDWVSSQAASFGGGPDGLSAALQSIDGMVLKQALVMAYTDEFIALMVGIAVVLPLVFLLRPLPKGHHNMAMH
ncbi:MULTISPECIES: MDR family MFS transporter [unclassified Novosphingobium]|uniref:MDR family MFS transporter n=1 Tax=unclassified Novosphingobium TaxID=2644732 RepID=UPI001494D06D|nr:MULTISPECIES: MDR family MFS transporter [unclassified Novosphingobium]MBB3357818.1 DHA2 family multidrug resistance protein [Novosphingobium sp. BK256]MBB3373518.1 DHA2 family multidrug resistance protein [Novosphingobium sp. BK280]MBB3377930.1 DHA2 family multidrug resistance protein [Novosphingobium sp. BK258]MBB3420285.1 DHA2 family multidrug resistance protein [Novosphingobium sp. BK267]MBB3447393.1 DHA2 family multidrug resistance protein [Novosphingobium sp. BK352]